MSQTQEQQRFAIFEVACSWLAWANDTGARYAAAHCPRYRTNGPAVQLEDIAPPQSATLGLHPVAQTR